MNCYLIESFCILRVINARHDGSKQDPEQVIQSIHHGINGDGILDIKMLRDGRQGPSALTEHLGSFLDEMLVVLFLIVRQETAIDQTQRLVQYGYLLRQNAFGCLFGQLAISRESTP